MARSFAVAQNYRKSAVQYDQLIAIDPQYTIPAGAGWVLYSDHQYSAARTQFNVMLAPTRETVTNQMAYEAQRTPAVGRPLTHTSAGKLAARACGPNWPGWPRPVPTSRSGWPPSLICDYDATLAWQEAFRLERDAKELKGSRNQMAVAQYALIQFEPSNTGRPTTGPDVRRPRQTRAS